GRHARRDPDDAAPRPAQGRGAARRRRQPQLRAEADDVRGAEGGLRRPRPAALLAGGLPRALLPLLPLPRVPPQARRDLEEGERGEVLPDARLRGAPALGALLDAPQGPLARQDRQGLPPLLLPRELALPAGRDRLRSVHEPLRDALALLPVHARRRR